MTSPFHRGQNAEVFDAMLDLRWKEWARLRKNRLARKRYAEAKLEREREERRKNQPIYED